MSLGRKFVYITIPKDYTQPNLTSNLYLEFSYNTNDGIVTEFIDYFSRKNMTSLINTYVVDLPVIYDSEKNKLNNLIFTWLNIYTDEKKNIMYEIFGALLNQVNNFTYGVSYIIFNPDTNCTIKSYDSKLTLKVEFNSTYTINITDYDIVGPKFVNIIIPKDTTQPDLKSNLYLEFYYNKNIGIVTEFIDYISRKNMTSLINKYGPVIYDSVNNKLSNLLFTWLNKYNNEKEKIMYEIFGFLLNQVNNINYGVSFISFQDTFCLIQSYDSKITVKAEFQSVYKINITDDIGGPIYLNITLRNQNPSPPPEQTLLKTQICMKFYYSIKTSILTDLIWVNPDTNESVDITHLIIQFPFSPAPYPPKYDKNGNSITSLFLSWENNSPSTETPANKILMENIFGRIMTNTDTTGKPVWLVNIISIDKTVNLYVLGDDTSILYDYNLIFNPTTIQITDIEIEYEPKYLNITLETQVDPNPILIQQNLLITPICLQFFYAKLNGDIIKLEWFDHDPNINDYVDITHLLYDFKEIDPKPPFPPQYSENDSTLTPVYLSWINYPTEENKNLMQKIFGSIKDIYDLNINQPVGLVGINSNYKILDFYVLDTDGNIIYYFTVRYRATIPITDTNSCCFSEGTKILSLSNQQPIDGCLTSQLKEEYRLVQDLIIGDFVKTYLHGYRKVSRVISGNFVNNPKDEGVSNCMYRMLKTEDNGLIEDLTLTRNHGVLVDKLTENEEKKVDKNNLPVIDNLLSIITADSDKFEKVLDTNVYKYYHFSLETDGDEDRRFAVYANGILVEVPSNNMMDGALNIKPLDF